MKNNKKGIAIIITSILIACIGIVILLDVKKVGKEIDSYKGATVHYNGIIYAKAYGENKSEDGYYYGQKWQCVEYVKRFYKDIKNHEMPEVYGHAKDFFDINIEQGKLNKSRGLVQYKNGENIKPKEDDLLVFRDTKYGHVAIVTEVGEDYIEVVQQNILAKPRERYELKIEDNKYYVGTKKQPVGWLRKE